MSEETSQTQEHNPMVMGGIAVALIVFLAVGAVAMQGQASDASSVEAAPSTQVVSSPSADGETTAGVQETKTLEIEGEYTSPGGPETIGIKITLDSEIITDSVVEVHAENPISNLKQTDFAAAHKELVVGKNINEITLDKVAGASLTTKGYNEAIEKLKAQING